MARTCKVVCLNDSSSRADQSASVIHDPATADWFFYNRVQPFIESFNICVVMQLTIGWASNGNTEEAHMCITSAQSSWWWEVPITERSSRCWFWRMASVRDNRFIQSCGMELWPGAAAWLFVFQAVIKSITASISLSAYTLPFDRENVFTVVAVQRRFHRLNEDGRFCPKIFSINNQPFRESALDELEKREGAGTFFVHSTIARCSSTSCWPIKHFLE